MMEVRLSTVTIGGEQHLLVYDLRRAALVGEICDYAEAMTSHGLTASTVLQECTYLKQFWEYLGSQGIELAGVEDQVLLGFRDYQLSATIKSKMSRGGERAAKATTNAKLRRVYHWLHWLAEEQYVPPSLIGSRGRVRSTLSGPQGRSREISVWDRRVSIGFPLLFRVPGGKSKHRLPKDVPTEITRDALHAFFFADTDSQYVAHRNCLLIDIAAETGMRRGSINSIRVDQFDEKALDAAEDEVWIQPERQKFGYVNSFPIPVYLASRIASFISEQREEFIDSKGVGPATHQGYVFLSARDGRPLTDRAVSQVVSRAMRAVGMSKGVSIHSFRAKFASEEIDRETSQRARMGLDTSAASVSQAVAMKLGHRDPKSLFPYAVAVQSKKARLDREERDSELRRLRAEVLELRAALKVRSKRQ